jgi:hypothetical protein
LNDKAPLPSIDPADKNLVDTPDWQKIEAAYRVGKSLRAISAQFGVGKNAISRKAKQEGWEKSGTEPGQDVGQERDKPATTEVVPPSNDDYEHFDWDDEIVVIHEQPRTAVYFNPNGALVIRQDRWPDKDQFVFIAPGYFEQFMEKLTEMLGIPEYPASGSQ